MRWLLLHERPECLNDSSQVHYRAELGLRQQLATDLECPNPSGIYRDGLILPGPRLYRLVKLGSPRDHCDRHLFKAKASDLGALVQQDQRLINSAVDPL